MGRSGGEEAALQSLKMLLPTRINYKMGSNPQAAITDNNNIVKASHCQFPPETMLAFVVEERIRPKHRNTRSAICRNRIWNSQARSPSACRQERGDSVDADQSRVRFLLMGMDGYFRSDCHHFRMYGYY